MKDIYKLVVKDDKVSQKFKLLSECNLYDPAKNIIKNITALMSDKDGYFIQQFQTDGFNARLWEIYLFIFLKENNFTFLDDVNRPDFHVKKKGIDLYIEASLSAEKEDDNFSEEFIRESMTKKDLSEQQQLIDNYIIRMGSVLFSKLNKKYWDLEWVKGKPLILAITPSHNFIANFLPDAKIIEYLYGIRKVVQLTENGLEYVEDKIIIEHKFSEKVIPSNFFSQPLSENISAVIFTNNSDINKFNRMGFQHKLTDKNLILLRTGSKYDPKPGATAQNFSYRVKDDSCNENWSESVSIFHNPNALIKIDKAIFEDVRQVRLESDNTFGGIMTDDFVYHSINRVVELKE